MAFITFSWLIDLIIIFSPFVMGVYIYLTWTYNYWKDRNVPFAKPVLLLGSLRGLSNGKAHADIILGIYKQFKGERYCGIYQFRQPTLMIRDPELVERILIKDFSHFEDRPLPLDPENEPLTVNLVNIKGEQWRNLRHKLSPAFSSGKLKGMFQQICNCGDNLLQLVNIYAHTKEIADAKALVTSFSSDVIASCAFGLQFELESPEEKKFREMVAKATGGSSSLNALRMGLNMFFPELAKLVGIRSVPLDAEEYFMAITRASIEHRINGNIKREDFFQLLLDLKAQEEGGKPVIEPNDDLVDQDDVQLKYNVKLSPEDENILEFTEEVVAAQSFVFLAAGSETVSTSISIIMHYLASYPDVQSRLQSEIDLVLANHGSWTYQALKDMTYLDQVIQESQRMFPIAHVHIRNCTIPYKVPGSDLIIEKGINVLIPIQALQTDPTYFSRPDKFDPDRFEGTNFKPSSVFSPFGDGPRICIAMRFAVLEMKACVAKILSKYCMKSSSKTLTPLRYDPNTFNVKPLGGIWITFEPRASND